jgi:hypothetical protein
MNNTNLSVSDVGAVLMGAGLVKLDDLIVGLGLIGAGVLLKVLVAVLNKNNIPVQTNNLG